MHDITDLLLVDHIVEKELTSAEDHTHLDWAETIAIGQGTSKSEENTESLQLNFIYDFNVAFHFISFYNLSSTCFSSYICAYLLSRVLQEIVGLLTICHNHACLIMITWLKLLLSGMICVIVNGAYPKKFKNYHNFLYNFGVI